MSAERKNRRVEVGFVEWFGLVCKYDHSAYPRLLSILLLLVCASLLAMNAPIVGFSLFFGMGAAFLWAFRMAWRRALEHPPWYLRSVGESPPWTALSPNLTASLKVKGEKDAGTDDD